MIDCMDVREAYERRVWRVALLLTDDVHAAEEILVRVVGVQPELQKIGDTRLDRMVVQASREMTPDADRVPLDQAVEIDEPTRTLWHAVRDLGPQAREAWVFRQLEGMDPIRTAQALDCSRNALEEVHLAGARRVLEARLGESEAVEATRRLAAALEGLDASEALARAAARRSEVMRRRRWVSATLLVVLLICFGLMVFVLVDLLDWQRETEMGKMRTDMYSNPAPSSAISGESGGDGSGDGTEDGSGHGP